jgi:predicted transcriptional regulator of viral defense system
MTIRAVLWNVAVEQCGYVTSADATRLGVPVVELGKLAARGKLERISYGLYRFGEWPVTDRDQFMEAVLWTRDPAAALSHETALDVLELCDANPDRTHVTVPVRRKLRRINSPTPVVIHYEDLAEAERGWWQQIPTVTASTAIRQAIESGTRLSLIEQAIYAAVTRGLITGPDAEALRAASRERSPA